MASRCPADGSGPALLHLRVGRTRDEGGRFIAGIAGPIHGPSPSALRAPGPDVRLSGFVPDESVEPGAASPQPLSARHAKKATQWAAFFACLAERGSAIELPMEVQQDLKKL